MIRIDLPTSALEASFVVLRSLCGRDEMALPTLGPTLGPAVGSSPSGDGLAVAMDLVARLCSDVPGGLTVAEIPSLSVADFDRVTTRLFASLYGERLDCQGRCRACGEGFEFSLTCDEIVPPVEPHTSGTARGVYDRDGVRFRLPAIADLISGKTADLWRSCCIEGQFTSAEAADTAFAAIAPLGIDDIESLCPKCGHVQSLRFDMADYLVSMLRRERPFLLHEIHCLARAYGWSLDDILSLARDNRRDLVRLVTHDAARGSDRRNLAGVTS